MRTLYLWLCQRMKRVISSACQSVPYVLSVSFYRVHRVLEKSLKVLEFWKKNSRPLKVLEKFLNLNVPYFEILHIKICGQSLKWFCSCHMGSTPKYVFHSKFWCSRVWYVFLSILLVLENCNFRSLKVLEKCLNFVLSVCYEPCFYLFTTLSLCTYRVMSVTVLAQICLAFRVSRVPRQATKIKCPDIPGRFMKIPDCASSIYHFSARLH